MKTPASNVLSYVANGPDDTLIEIYPGGYSAGMEDGGGGYRYDAAVFEGDAKVHTMILEFPQSPSKMMLDAKSVLEWRNWRRANGRPVAGD